MQIKNRSLWLSKDKVSSDCDDILVVPTSFVKFTNKGSHLVDVRWP